MSAVEAAWLQIGFGCRGSSDAIPLPRCVLSAAPASLAAWIVAPSAAVCPSATTTPDGCRAADEFDCAGSFGGQRHQHDPAARGLLELLEQAPVGIADRPGRVGAAIAIAFGEERPLEVDAEHPGSDVGKGVAGGGDRS